MSALGTQSAHAAGTSAGTTITNTVTVDYKVGTISQTAKTATNSFKVDRKVNVLVETQDSATVQVTPGQAQVATKFKVTNLSNTTLDFALTAAQLSGTTAKHGGTDNFDVTISGIYVDTNNSDKILTVSSKGITEDEVIKIVQSKGFKAEIMD